MTLFDPHELCTDAAWSGIDSNLAILRPRQCWDAYHQMDVMVQVLFMHESCKVYQCHGFLKWLAWCRFLVVCCGTLHAISVTVNVTSKTAVCGVLTGRWLLGQSARMADCGYASIK